MNWLTVFCVSVAAACLTLAAMHAAVWVQDRTARAHLSFSVLAIGVALFAWCNLLTAVADTPDQFASGLWWMQVTLFIMVAGIVAFVRSYFRTARLWLGQLALAVRGVALIVNFVRPPVFNYEYISAVRKVDFFGVPVSVAEGLPSPWTWFGQLGLGLLLVFVVDASFRLWRVGNAKEKRRAAVIGFPTAIFVGAGSAWAALVFAGVVDWPHLEVVAFLPVLCAMAYELSADVLRAARLSRELKASEGALRDSEQRMTRAAEAARELGGRLINAQEDERRRIARDLHDDFSQRLSLLSVELALLSRLDEPSLHASPISESRQGFDEIIAQVRELSSEVHRLSHQLHPAKLDQLGLETAARSWCRDITRQSGVRVEFQARGVPADVPPETALCAYRILQESLQNVARHSGVDLARVLLTAADGTLHLSVRDEGKGFDLSSGDGGGLGLLSMRERSHLLHGSLTIDSAPNRGTCVTLELPLQEGASTELPAALGGQLVQSG